MSPLHLIPACIPAALLCLAIAPSLSAAEEGAPVHHRLSVRLTPEAHAIVVEDELTPVPLTNGRAEFQLHAGLAVELIDEDLALHTTEDDGKAPAGSGEMGAPLTVRSWSVSRKDGEPLAPERTLRLRYSGKIYHPIETGGEEYARSFSSSPGIIGDEGVMLAGSTVWVPTFGDAQMTFELALNLPAAWDVVSQGERTRHELDGERRLVTWTCPHPMEEIYVIAARFHEYSSATGNVTAYAFLREDDKALADKYLGVTAQYIDMYRQLIGPYPFKKFALVENFWETGYGMPSFTLLGSTVIRLPFILHSSYPHEILHNWWGNGVYVDWRAGNWCEGLTAYLADHLIKEGRGKGVEYRRDTLGGYRAYAGGEKDFPLSEFRSRHSSATQAVGYGKSLMLFHMLRLQVGDELFARGLQRFYRRNQFKKASYADLEAVFSETAESDLSAFFAQWVQRTGAPRLDATVMVSENKVELIVEQVQEGEKYDLLVPVAITREGQSEALWTKLHMTARAVTLSLQGGAPVTRIDIDPEFDVFRHLHREEIPPTLSSIFGAEAVTLVLPDEASPGAVAWAGFADSWRGDGVEVVRSEDLEALPNDRSVWLLGRDNRFRSLLEAPLLARGVGGPPAAKECFVYVLRHPANPGQAIGWIGCEQPPAFAGLARKLPHYGKYSFLEFEGPEPTNTAKGQWDATASPLVWTRTGETVARGSLPERAPLGELAPVFSPEALMEHVEYLGSPDRGGRGIDTEGLLESETYIVKAFRAAGLQPAGDEGGYLQVWPELNGPDGTPVRLANIVGYLPGSESTVARQPVVIGAHYDHLGLGWPDVHEHDEHQVHPGADDNASGVAVLLELARDLAATHTPKRPIVFVAFTGEEWGLKGSRHYVESMQLFPASETFAMINLDTVGRLEGKPLTVFGTSTASEWMHIAMGIGFTTGIQSKCVPDDPGGSDQVAFHEARVPAVQLFSGGHFDYHRPTDTVDKVDAAGLVKVVSFTKEMVVYLADRLDPLTTSFGDPGAAKPAAGPSGGARRVSLGTMPDFAFTGPGVKVAAVSPGSAAEEAGLVVGDLLLSIDGVELANVRAYSDFLKSKAPGDEVRIQLRRGEGAGAVVLEQAARLRAR